MCSVLLDLLSFFWTQSSDVNTEQKHDGCTHTWPSSWAIVKAVLSPLSSLMLQLLYGSHTVPSSASPEQHKTSFLKGCNRQNDGFSILFVFNNVYPFT